MWIFLSQVNYVYLFIMFATGNVQSNCQIEHPTTGEPIEAFAATGGVHPWRVSSSSPTRLSPLYMCLDWGTRLYSQGKFTKTGVSCHRRHGHLWKPKWGRSEYLKLLEARLTPAEVIYESNEEEYGLKNTQGRNIYTFQKRDSRQAHQCNQVHSNKNNSKNLFWAAWFPKQIAKNYWELLNSFVSFIHRAWVLLP